MPKKGKLEEIINFAKFHDGISQYRIFFRNLDEISEISLEDWLIISELDSIPIHRIVKIKKKDKLIFERQIR